MSAAFQPKRILMLKGHSAGIGDLLRSSAAWRVLKNAYPNAELHLLFFTREPGYASEGLFKEHELLQSFQTIDKRTKTWADWKRFWLEMTRMVKQVNPDLVIDFESNGIRTSLVAIWCWMRFGSRTIGVNAVAGRGLLYGKSTMSEKRYARKNGLPAPMDYTDRDFVVLSALDLPRRGQPIEMKETGEGRRVREELYAKQGWDKSVRLLGVNIGCGTPGAEGKRPDLGQVCELVIGLQRAHGFKVILTGAPFEIAVNAEFCALHRERGGDSIYDLAGKSNLSGLTGLIAACELFISSDSGPYHMAVAMKIPTLAIFKWHNSAHFHQHPWIRCCVANAPEHTTHLRHAAEELLRNAATFSATV